MSFLSIFRISLPESPSTLPSPESNREKTKSMLSSDAENRPRRKKARVTRRASTNAAYLPFLRILKRDIRRKYIDMLGNIFNYSDPKVVSQFFKTFAIPEFRHCDTVTEEIERKTVFRSAYIQGIKSLLGHYVPSSYMLPDQFAQFDLIRVCKRSDEIGSRVISKLSIRGTWLYQPKVPVDLVIVDEEGNVDQSQFQLHPSPQGIYIEGICVMHLDGNHHIRVFEVVKDRLIE